MLFQQEREGDSAPWVLYGGKIYPLAILYVAELPVDGYNLHNVLSNPLRALSKGYKLLEGEPYVGSEEGRVGTVYESCVVEEH